MIRIFLDTDILLDLITGRSPHGAEAATLFVLIDQKKIGGCVSSLSFSNSYYVLRKYASHRKVLTQLTTLEHMLEVKEVNGSMIKKSLSSSFRDFADAIQYRCATSDPHIRAIITRNIKDYKASELPVMSPVTFLASWYKSDP